MIFKNIKTIATSHIVKGQTKYSVDEDFLGRDFLIEVLSLPAGEGIDITDGIITIPKPKIAIRDGITIILP